MRLLRKLRVALTPRSWKLTTRLSNGAIVRGYNRSGYGGRGIYIFRDAIEPELLHLERFLGAEGVFVDAGANTGVYSLKAAKHFGGRGTVIAVEPFPATAAMLAENVRTNRFTNVRIRVFCLGERTTAGTLWLNQGKPNSFSLVARTGECDGYSVLTVALDDLAKWEGLTRLDYLKLDVEGAEQEVLAGGLETIRKFRPIIQAEIIIKRMESGLPGYTIFQSPDSINRLYVPNEHEKIGIPETLGWKRIQ